MLVRACSYLVSCSLLLAGCGGTVSPAGGMTVDGQVDRDGASGSPDGGSAGGDAGSVDAAWADADPYVSTPIGSSPFTQLSLVAGDPGENGADGVGTSASFHHPRGIAADEKGTLYIADAGNATIRKVVLSTGTVSTIAGQVGTFGDDDGVGSAARFYGPTGLALDTSGNLYIADTGNQTIRKLELATGSVTTVAGQALQAGLVDGIASAARFDQPSGLAVDGAGNLYVADQSNNTIRKVALATGAVTTFAGSATAGHVDGTSTAARFNGPAGLVYDGTGSLYVADRLNATVRKVVLATGAVTTFAGGSTMVGEQDRVGTAASFIDPVGIALSGKDTLVVAEYDGCRVRAIDIASATVTSLVGDGGIGTTDGVGDATELDLPFAVAADGAGDAYVADSGGSTLRKLVLATRTLTTAFGNVVTGKTDGTGAAARFYGVSSLGLAGTSLYAADTFNEEIRTVALDNDAVTTFPGYSGFVTAVAYDGAGSLYVAEPDLIKKLDLASHAVTTIAGHVSSTGSVDGTGTAAAFSSVSGMVYDGAGNLFVSDAEGIRHIVVATGQVTTLAGSTTESGSMDGTGAAARFHGPSGLATDSTGNLYVADSENNEIRKVVIATGVVWTLAGQATSSAQQVDGTATAATFKRPTGLALDGAGNLYIADTDDSAIRKLVLATGAVTTVVGDFHHSDITLGATASARLSAPVALAYGPGPALYIADSNAVLVLK